MSPLESALALQIKAAGLPSPAREYKFHPGRRWRFDFCWPDRKLAVEVEGGTWVKGRHNTGMGFQHDCEKYNQAALDGWTVLRFVGAHVQNGTALAIIEQAIPKPDWRKAMGDDR